MFSRSGTKVLTVALATLLIAACGDPDTGSPGKPGGAGEVGELTVDYPLEGSVFPPDFTPPTFLWHDDAVGVDTWILTASFGEGREPIAIETTGPRPPRGKIDERALGDTNEIYRPTEYQSSMKSWTPAPELWAEIQQRSAGRQATLSFTGVSRSEPDQIRSRGEVTFTTSTDPVGAPIFYRDVPLMPSMGEDGKIAPLDRTAMYLINWRLRDTSHPDSKVVLTGMPSCANCHSFSSDGGTLGMDIDGPDGDKGSYAIVPLAKRTVIGDQAVITWNSFPEKLKGHKTIGFLSRISPDGGFVLSTVNEALYVNNFTDFRFLQVFYPTRGILAWYSVETGEMKALPGADDPEYVHCSPVWSPDGNFIVFSRARAMDPYPEGRPRPTHAGDPNELPIRYDLYRMPFNDGKGGKPVPIPGAGENGMSNTFPKISPDGKWLVWTKCRNGLLMRPDGRLWIVSMDGGEPREMNCNTSLMNSWHSFSPNGRWMVFSSKVNTPYTQMFLTHLDEEGNDTPPILIPNSTAQNRAVNIPEFVARDFDALDVIEVPAVKHYRGLHDALILMDDGRFEEAIPLLERALEKDPKFSRALIALGYSLLKTNHIDEARTKLLRAIDLAPESSLAHVNLGLTFLEQGLTVDAADQFEIAAGMSPEDSLALFNLGLVRIEQGELDAARRALEGAAEIEPRNPDVRNALGGVFERQGELEAAAGQFRLALREDPNHVLAGANLAKTLILLDRGDEALAQLRRAVEAAPDNRDLRDTLCVELLRRKQAEEALAHLDVMLEKAPEDTELGLVIAWLLSTLPDDAERDGARAVRLAEACLAAEGERADILDVLAAAYAEAGRFPEAVKTATRAFELQMQGGVGVAPGLSERLASYRAGRPHRQ